MILIKAISYKLPSYEALKEFEDSFPDNVIRISEVKSRVIKKVLQASFKYFPDIYSFFRKPGNNEAVFTLLMAPHDIYKIIPSGLKAKSVYLYVYDIWEREYEYFEKVIRALNINTVFFSSLQTKNDFEQRLKDTSIKFIWLSEAIRAEKYKFLPYDKKDIDVLSFGRKYNNYHREILEYTRNNKIKYLYQENDQLLFKTEPELIDALSGARISICFPSSVTHQEISGNISKVTMRYFQSMACKCLILGRNPDDLLRLFDYSPVIEIDEKNPREQLQEILDNYEKYIPLIEKNYLEVTNKHQYINRVNTVLDHIEN